MHAYTHTHAQNTADKLMSIHTHTHTHTEWETPTSCNRTLTQHVIDTQVMRRISNPIKWTAHTFINKLNSAYPHN